MSLSSEMARQRIWEYVRDRYNEDGVPATVREIAAAVGFSSTSPVYYHLSALTKAGRLWKARGKYLPVATSPESRASQRPISSCPWGDTAHDYSMAIGTDLIFCRKCGDTISIVRPSAASIPPLPPPNPSLIGHHY